MKTDLFTSIGVAIVGIVIAFFITNLLISNIDAIEAVTVPTINTANTASPVTDYNFATLDEPDDEIFNFYALNPTVEAYVGNNPNAVPVEVTPTNDDTPEEPNPSPDGGE